MEKIVTVIAILSILGLVGLIVLIPFGPGFPYSGDHTGYITAVERGGMFNIANIYVKTDNQSSQEDMYCLKDDLYEKAVTFSKERKLVTVRFERGWFMPFWSCNTANTRVVGVEVND